MKSSAFFDGDLQGQMVGAKSLKFTDFMGYPAYTAPADSNGIQAELNGTFFGGDDIIILETGSGTKQVIGPIQTVSSLSFNLHKTSGNTNTGPGVPLPTPAQ